MFGVTFLWLPTHPVGSMTPGMKNPGPGNPAPGWLSHRLPGSAYFFFPPEGRPEEPDGREGALLPPLGRLGAEGRPTEPEGLRGAGGLPVLLWGGRAVDLGGTVVLLVVGGRVPDCGLLVRGGMEEVLRLVPELPGLP